MGYTADIITQVKFPNHLVEGFRATVRPTHNLVFPIDFDRRLKPMLRTTALHCNEMAHSNCKWAHYFCIYVFLFFLILRSFLLLLFFYYYFYFIFYLFYFYMLSCDQQSGILTLLPQRFICDVYRQRGRGKNTPRHISSSRAHSEKIPTANPTFSPRFLVMVLPMP